VECVDRSSLDTFERMTQQVRSVEVVGHLDMFAPCALVRTP
jgi:hypothetical protein